MLRTATAAFLLATVAAGPSGAAEVLETNEVPILVESFAGGLDHPWGMAFLPDGGMLVTERPGTMRFVSAGGDVSAPIAGVPEVVARGQGGLLDVTLHPGFADNRLVYFSYSEAGDGGTNGTAIARGRLADDMSALGNVEVIFRQQPKVASNNHFGSRLVFDEDGYLFATLGERSAARYRVLAQDLGTHLGKVIRIRDDGSAPSDNPFADQSGAMPEIWSYGHRNPQGMALHPVTGAIWTHEHGPRGGDEVAIPKAGDTTAGRSFPTARNIRARRSPTSTSTRRNSHDRCGNGRRRSHPPAWPSTTLTRFRNGRATSSSVR